MASFKEKEVNRECFSNFMARFLASGIGQTQQRGVCFHLFILILVRVK